MRLPFFMSMLVVMRVIYTPKGVLIVSVTICFILL